MALLIWIPGIDGTIKNLGLCQLPSPNYNTMTQETSGKLGKAIKGQLSYNLSSDICPTSWSVASWVKLPSNYSSGNNIILCANTTESTDAKFYLSIISNTTLNIGRGTSSTLSYAYSFQVDNWYHVAATFNGTTTKLYLNGLLVNLTNSGTTKEALNYTVCGRKTTSSYTGLALSVNDVRIYDNCLSDEEVHELSLGKIGHWCLDTNNKNLFQSTPKSVHPASYLAYLLNMSENLVAGETYTLQLWNVTISHNRTSPFLSIYWGGGTVSLFNFAASLFDDNGYALHLTKTFTVSSSAASGSGATNAWLNIYNSAGYSSGMEGNVYIGNWKLEKGSIASPWNPISENDKILDISGYHNDLTINGTCSVSTGSKRYSKCINLPEATTLTCANPFAGQTTQLEWSISCWVKASALTNWSSKLNNFNYGNYLKTADNLSILYLNAGTNDYYSYAAGCPQLNTWTHVVFVFRNSDGLRQVWINGVLKASNGPNKTSTPLGMPATIEWFTAYGGDVSDLRLYATALSSSDIQYLYSLGN